MLKRILNMFKSPYKRAVAQGMSVGKGITVMGNADFGSEPYLIELGDNIRISSNVVFITHDGGTWAFRDIEKYKDVIKFGRIRVKNRTFIGANSVIMPGVSIGERCVIGAGSVVTKDVPDGTVVAGVPAKPLMTTEAYAEKCLLNQKQYDKKEYNEDKTEYLKKWVK